MEIQEYVDIKDYSTLHVGGQFRYFAKILSKEKLESIYSIKQNDTKYKNIPIFILGGGSNVIFSDGVLDVIALKIEIKGFDIVSEEQDYVDIKVGAGEVWDEIVSRTVEMNLSGFESLSAIPGTVGATPVQNVGAYGSEVKDTILEVEVFDIKNNLIKTISNMDCKFGYRESIFKNEAKGKYIITAVTYRLRKVMLQEKILLKRSSDLLAEFFWKLGQTIFKRTFSFRIKNFSPALNYPGVIKYFEYREITSPTLIEIRNAIIHIRREKLPNPIEIPNVGSFFKNSIVENKIANKIKKEYPNAVFFEIDEDHTKVPAGWLIENAGLKGMSFGNVSIYEKNALVLVNNGMATAGDIIKARNEIIKIVYDKFGIILEQEPELI